jgi:ubiquinone/menaquinone biosynthesis C-methylase UbiE
VNFDLYAKNWDTESRIERAKAIANEIRTHILDSNEKTAIEFGCGTGLVGFQLVEHFSSVTFIDISDGMIEQVKQKLSELNIQTASARCCDIMTSVPSDLSVDYIFSSLVLHHIIDTKNLFNQLYKLLNFGGHLLIVDLDIDDGSYHADYPDFDGHNGFDHLSLTNLSKEVGFSKVNIHTFYRSKKVFNGKENPYSLFILDAEK